MALHYITILRTTSSHSSCIVDQLSSVPYHSPRVNSLSSRVDGTRAVRTARRAKVGHKVALETRYAKLIETEPEACGAI